MPKALPACPTFHSDTVVKNGRTRHSNQNYKCRKFDVSLEEIRNEDLCPKTIGHRSLIAYCLKISPEQGLRVSCRFLNSGLKISHERRLHVPYRFLNSGCYVNAKYADVPQKVEISPKPKRCLTVQTSTDRSTL
jgi:transposase-like protein